MQNFTLLKNQSHSFLNLLTRHYIEHCAEDNPVSWDWWSSAKTSLKVLILNPQDIIMMKMKMQIQIDYFKHKLRFSYFSLLNLKSL